MPTVKVNGIEVEVAPGTNMIEAARQAGVDIPHYCYHPHLPVAGNCRMCLVDVEAGGRGPDIACNMQARDGLAIRTDTDNVKRMRRSVMEFLLVNHPLDCPICDQAGECRLQDYYMEHGQHHSRLADEKITRTKRQDIGDLIILDADRCIACSRCVRFSDEVTKTGELRLFNRTDHTEIGVFPGTRLSHHYQGCLADICPVGALTNKDFRFQKRSWYLRAEPSVCDRCATGCNIDVDHDHGEVFRYRPRRNDAVNKSWMCDFGRLSYKRLAAEDRILTARGPEGAEGVDAVLAGLAAAVDAAARDHGDGSVGLVLGTRATNEANWAMLRALRAAVPGARVFLVEGNDPDAFDYTDDLLVHADKNPNTAGVRLIAEADGAVGDAEALRAALADGGLRLLLVLADDVLARLGEVRRPEALAFFGTWANATSEAARWVLPLAAAQEVEGSFTNFQGRVQRLQPAIPAAGDSRPGQVLAAGLARALGEDALPAGAAGVFHDLAANVPAFFGLSLAGLGAEGALVHREPPTEQVAPPDTRPAP